MTAFQQDSMGRERLAWRVESELDWEGGQGQDRWDGTEAIRGRGSEKKGDREGRQDPETGGQAAQPRSAAF